VLNGTVGTAVPGLSLNDNFNINLITQPGSEPSLRRRHVGIANGANRLFVINPLTDQIVATLSVWSPTLFTNTVQSYIAVNSATGRVYVADFDDFELVAIDGNTNTVVATIIMPFGPSTVGDR
jgi:DNA-binding beta-propeller fold protein YncE